VTFWAFYPETKKVTLEEMHALFTRIPWFIPTAPPPTKVEGVNELRRKVEMYRGGGRFEEKGVAVESETQ
jgi:hypothetical protein